MPQVHTIEGSRDLKCKMVRNKRTGCEVKLCKTGKGATGWQFMKGTTRCPAKRKRRRKR